MNYEDMKYTKEHEWVRVDGDVIIMGITDHAQAELGDITFIELPQIGKKIKQNDVVSTVESVKAASDIYAPVSGEVIGVNDELESAPEKINRGPYSDGWICRIRPSDVTEMEDLMSYESYNDYIATL